MDKNPLLPLSNIGLMSLATYLSVVVVGALSIISLTNLWPRLAFAGLCLAFALVYAAAVRREDFARLANGYFAVQTIDLQMTAKTIAIPIREWLFFKEGHSKDLKLQFALQIYNNPVKIPNPFQVANRCISKGIKTDKASVFQKYQRMEIISCN